MRPSEYIEAELVGWPVTVVPRYWHVPSGEHIYRFPRYDEQPDLWKLKLIRFLTRYDKRLPIINEFGKQVSTVGKLLEEVKGRLDVTFEVHGTITGRMPHEQGSTKGT